MPPAAQRGAIDAQQIMDRASRPRCCRCCPRTTTIPLRHSVLRPEPAEGYEAHWCCPPGQKPVAVLDFECYTLPSYERITSASPPCACRPRRRRPGARIATRRNKRIARFVGGDWHPRHSLRTRCSGIASATTTTGANRRVSCPTFCAATRARRRRNGRRRQRLQRRYATSRSVPNCWPTPCTASRERGTAA